MSFLADGEIKFLRESIAQEIDFSEFAHSLFEKPFKILSDQLEGIILTISRILAGTATISDLPPNFRDIIDVNYAPYRQDMLDLLEKDLEDVENELQHLEFDEYKATVINRIKNLLLRKKFMEEEGLGYKLNKPVEIQINSIYKLSKDRVRKELVDIAVFDEFIEPCIRARKYCREKVYKYFTTIECLMDIYHNKEE